MGGVQLRTVTAVSRAAGGLDTGLTHQAQGAGAASYSCRGRGGRPRTSEHPGLEIPDQGAQLSPDCSKEHRRQPPALMGKTFVNCLPWARIVWYCTREDAEVRLTRPHLVLGAPRLSPHNRRLCPAQSLIQRSRMW